MKVVVYAVAIASAAAVAVGQNYSSGYSYKVNDCCRQLFTRLSSVCHINQKRVEQQQHRLAFVQMSTW